MFIADFNNSLMREPDILVGFTHDFYVAPVGYNDSRDNQKGTPATMKSGETFSYDGKEIIFNKFVLPEDMSAMRNGGKFRIGVDLTVKNNGKEEKLEPFMESAGQGPKYFPAELKDANLKIEVTAMSAANKQVTLSFSKLDAAAVPAKESLTVEASIKPFISLVWTGILIMVAGFIISAFRRSKESLSLN
jgi:cytochrome c-type biogenesis protein CcmF